ncbi:hypothetical protein Q6251_30005, partial [Klebsiella quasipneumoniae]|nr:hypothetical protein [Klebsiella quasipneumoniae]
ALGTVALFILYPFLATRRLVGTEIAHAVPLTLVAGLGHASMGVAIARRTLLNDELERGTLIVPFGLAVPNHKRYVLLYAPGALSHPG